MEGFWFPMWDIIRGWSGFGQGFFILAVLGGLLTLVKYIFYYTGVVLHGWPPPGTPFDDEED